MIITVQHRNAGASVTVNYIFEIIGDLNLPGALRLVSMNGKGASLSMVSNAAYRKAIRTASQSLKVSAC